MALYPKRTRPNYIPNANARASSSRTTGQRSWPREITWYRAPGNSIREGLAMPLSYSPCLLRQELFTIQALTPMPAPLRPPSGRSYSLFKL